MNKTQHGFGALGVVIIIFVLAAITGSGWLFLQRSNKVEPASATTETSTTTTKSPEKAATDPYEGWKSYTLKYEKVSFKYPASWQIKDTSFANEETIGGGSDVVTLLGSDGFQMNIATGGPNDYGFPMGGLTSIHTDPVTFVGKQAYMNLAQTGSENTGIADKINLTVSKTSLTDFPVDKNVTAPSYKDGVVENKFLILMDYDANVNRASNNADYPHNPLSKVLKDSNYLNAKLVISSFAY